MRYPLPPLLRTVRAGLIALALFAGCLVLRLNAQTIITRTLDVGTYGGDLGKYTSHAIVSGNPAISYWDGSNDHLKYVRALDASGTSWGTPVTVDSTGYTGDFYTSLVVVDGNPAICYHSLSNGTLRYVRATDDIGTVWGAPVIVDGETVSVGLYASLRVVNGNPAISYYDHTNHFLKYVRANDAGGTSWGPFVILDSGDRGFYNSLAVVNGNPAISYYDSSNGALRYIRANDASGTSWPVAMQLTVTGANNVGLYTSLAIINGNPAISYFDNTNLDLKYVRASDANGAGWGTPLTVTSTGNVGSYTSLVVVNGNPAISYYDNTNHDLKYVQASNVNGTSWLTPMTVDSVGDVGQHTSMVVVNGNPAISYYDATNADLKYVRANDVSGTAWSAAITLDADIANPRVGLYTSQAIVNGNPAISYHDSTSYDLKYVRATDAGGTNWGTPVIVDGAGIVGWRSSLVVINGNPAISYRDSTNRALKYVRANDASGTSWGTPVTLEVEITGEVGDYSSLAVVNGNPAISFYNSYRGQLKYVRASDTSGTSWPAAVSVAGTMFSPVGRYTSLAVVNGRPAISYYDETNDNLNFVRASNVDGTSWGTPVTVDSTGDVGQQTKLIVANGNPAIGYYDVTNGSLKYARSSNVNGTSWSTRVTLATAVGSLSLAAVNGNPAFSYCDGINVDLKYLRALDASGTSWGTPVTIDSIGYVGLYTSLAVVNGNPAISYYDSTNGDLKWATLIVDADTDGLLDSWELTYWPNTTGHNPLDDHDHDGYNELLELALGLNPTLPSTGGLPPAISEGGYLTMTITKQAGVTYEVQSAGSLLTGQPDSFSAASTTVLTNNATTLKVRDNFLIGSSPPRFMRVKVTASP